MDSKDIMSLSIAICCHNSAKRLPETLQYIQKQQITFPYPWEVLIIDNASTDNTLEIAEKIWAKNPIVPLRLISETELGLTYARNCALRHAQYTILAFIDDDNWINQNWVNRVFEIFTQNKTIAACGGPIYPICELPPPDWFSAYQGNYTTWDLYPQAQYIQHPLCGAGLCIKKTIWKNLINKGFQPILTDRKGKSLSSGGDFELGYALLLAGHKLWYDPKLHLQHFIPKERLTWPYLIKLNEGFGKQSTTIEIYNQLLDKCLNKKQQKHHIWIIEALKCSYHLIRHSFHGAFPQYLRHEGHKNALLWAEQWGRLCSLLQERSFYDKRYNTLKSTPWIQHTL